MLLFIGGSHSALAQIADLSKGEWFKLKVEQAGIYRIDYSFLRQLGIDPSRINPSHIRIFGNEGGMLPQRIDAARPPGLMENAIFVSGQADGKFDSGDFILFYAEGPDRADYVTSLGLFGYESNLYSDANYYFLTVGDIDGKRIGTSANDGDGIPVTDFDDFFYHEVDEYNDQHSGREWYGERFGVSTDVHTISFQAESISASSPVRIVSDVLGQSHSASSMSLTLNGIAIGVQDLVQIPNSRYGVKGIHRRDTFDIDPSAAGMPARSTHEVTFQFHKGTGFSQALLDFLLVCFKRDLKLYGNQTIFLSAGSLENPVSKFLVKGVSNDAQIWDITDPYNVLAQQFTLENGTAQFATPTETLRKFVVFKANAPAPTIVGRIERQNIRGFASPDMIIVTHPSFLNEANRLAAHRESTNGLNVQVVTPEEIYNDFSSGRQDVSAIRDFVRHQFGSQPSSPRFLLLFGKTSYDYKDRLTGNTNFVITYESRNSLHPLQTYSSDDYFGFLEDGEGDWNEGSTPTNHTLDIGVGRLPVTTAEEARNVVDKIIEYEQNPSSLGYWRKRAIFVADDGNNEDGFDDIHQSQADQLATFVEETSSGIEAKKLFMGTYEKTIKPNGESIPAFTDDILRAFDRGALIINYTGHGSEVQWADENVFNTAIIGELDNELYPFLITATCEFGRHDDPSRISGAERIVKAKSSGVVGMVTTARDVSAVPNFNLNIAFYEALFERAGNFFRPLGEVFRQTKNNSTSGVSNRNFSLLADPSMTLALPPHVVAVTELKTIAGSDTLKALSTVKVRGEIRTFSGEKLETFNGTLAATLYDKRAERVTIGRNDPAFEFEEWKNALFRGQASVKDGEFEMTFMLPRNIAYTVATGKLSLYAADAANFTDASGMIMGFTVGGTEADVAPESEPPVISLYIGDTTFVNGGITNPDTYLVARLDDNTGINISNYGIGNSIIAELDGGEMTFMLNDYFIADVDDYTGGWIRFPLNDLPPGRHAVTLTAWDLHNNSSKATVDFIVTDGEQLVIEAFGNYPNPFQDRTSLFFTHNRSGDDLQGTLSIQNTAGSIIGSIDFTVTNSPYQVDLMELDAAGVFGKKLPGGLYLARLIVRSLTNGSKYEQVTKLIVLN